MLHNLLCEPTLLLGQLHRGTPELNLVGKLDPILLQRVPVDLPVFFLHYLVTVTVQWIFPLEFGALAKKRITEKLITEKTLKILPMASHSHFSNYQADKSTFLNKVDAWVYHLKNVGW